MRKPLLFLAALTLSLPLIGCDQVSYKTITGSVLTDREPLSGVAVGISGTSYQTVTGEDGLFSFRVEEQSVSYTLSASKEGYLNYRKTILKSDFVNDVYAVDINLFTEKLTINGTVKDDDGSRVYDVEVEACGQSTTTDSCGEYVLSIDRPLEAFTVTFSRQYFGTVTKEVTEFSSSSITVDATVNQNSFDLTGTVKTYGGALIENAEIWLTNDGEVFAATTRSDENGAFSFEGVNGLELPYTVKVSKPGHKTKTYTVNDSDATLDIELCEAEVELPGTIFPTIGNDNHIFLTRDSKGLYMDFELCKPIQYQQPKEEDIQLFVSTGATSIGRNGSPVLEFKMTSNDDIITVWDYAPGSATFVPDSAGVLWGTEVVYSTVKDTNSTKGSLFVAWEAFKKFGTAYSTVSKDSTIGVTVGFWSDFNTTAPWTGWDVGDDMLAYDGSTFITPECSFGYIRFDKHGNLYQSTSNEYVEPGTRCVKGTVKDSGGNPLEEATIQLKGTNMMTYSNVDGSYTLYMDSHFFALKPDIIVSKDGYTTVESLHDKSEFNASNTIENVDIVLENAGKTHAISGLWGWSNFKTKMSRNDTSFIFECTYESPFENPESGENVCSIWLAFGDALNSTTRSGKTVLEYKFLSTKAWCGVYNYVTNSFASWGNGIAFQWSGSTIKVTMPIAYVNGVFGSSFTLNDTIGVTFSQWDNDETAKFYGYSSSEGYFFNPDDPTTYQRWDKDNNLTVNA